MNQFRITSRAELLRDLPKLKGQETEWFPFARLEIYSGRVGVVDPAYFRGGQSFEIAPGSYLVSARIMRFDDGDEMSRVRLCSVDQPTLGPRLDWVGNDFGRLALFDFEILDQAGERLTVAEGEMVLKDMHAIKGYGQVQLGPDPRAVMAIVESAFGDGAFPVYELLDQEKRVGLEVAFLDSTNP